MRTPNIKISIIFPSYNGKKVIYNCLKSVENLENLNEIELIIVDNNSTDSTREIIKTFKTINLILLEQKSNLGFARACNIAVKKASGEYIFITNQDISFPKDFFTILFNLYKRIKKEKEVIISPAIVFPGNFINYFGANVHFLGFSYTPMMYQGISSIKQTFKTLKASGCSMFMKRNTFIELNGFDSHFFMYHEDTDFSLRAIRSGLSIYTTNETYILHQKMHMTLNSFTYYHIEKNRYIVIYKNIDSFSSLIPFLIVSEILLLSQAIVLKSIRLRLMIYKFFIQNYNQIKNLKFNEFNSKSKKLWKGNFNQHLDPIILGPILRHVRILRYFLKIINLIL
jgi:GT2 family glycosyltransferase